MDAQKRLETKKRREEELERVKRDKEEEELAEFYASQQTSSGK